MNMDKKTLKEMINNLSEEELKLYYKDIKAFNEQGSLPDDAFLRKIVDTESPYFLINVITISNIILLRIAEIHYNK